MGWRGVMGGRGGEELTPDAVRMVASGTTLELDDVALLRAQGFEVLSDNDPMPENVPAEGRDGDGEGLDGDVYPQGWGFSVIDP